MPKLLRIAKPFMPESFAIIMVILILETFSFYAMKAIIPLLSNINEPVSDYYDKLVTQTPVICPTFELLAMIFGALFIDFTFPREYLLIWPMMFWMAMPLFLYITYNKTLLMYFIRFMAILKGIMESLILSVGAQVYNSDETSQIYHYFMYAYCAYECGIFTVQSLIPMNAIDNNNCGTFDCQSLVVFLSSFAAVLALIIYMKCTDYFTPKESGPEVNFKNEFHKIIRILFVLIPYAIFWLYYFKIGPKLSYLPKLTNLLIFSVHDIPKLYSILKILVVVLYYNLLYRWFEKYILKHSPLLITIGGILLGLWPIIAAPMEYEHRDQYAQAGPVKPDAIQVTYMLLNKTLKLSAPNLLYPNPESPDITTLIDIPYFDGPEPQQFYKRNRDQIYVVRNDNKCPIFYHTFLYLSTRGYLFRKKTYQRYCFINGLEYVMYACDSPSIQSLIKPDLGVRDPNGKAVFCALLCPHSGTDRNYKLVMHETANSSRLEYYFIGKTDNLVKNYMCQTIEPGTYLLYDFCYIDTYELGPGSVTIFFEDNHGNKHSNRVVDSFKSTILDTPFLIFNIIRAIGEVLLIINGFYFFYIQLHPKHRTIGLVLWFMLIKFGAIFRAIDFYKSYPNDTSLYSLGEILIFTAILFYILQLFIKLNGDQSSE